MLRKYYQLTKPGIIYGNAITAIAGFLFASRGGFDAPLFAAMLIGLSLVIASSCVLNNYLDRDIDIAMERTKGRALVKGEISPRNALIFAAILGILGLVIFAAGTNLLAFSIALVGALVYVLAYTPLKKKSLYGTLVGSISGATPIIVGYCSAADSFDKAAFILFLILVIWQMPHFYAIAIRRLDEYAAAHVPVLPVEKGIHVTKIHIVAYVAAYLVATLSLAAFRFAGHTYAIVSWLVGLTWLFLGFEGFKHGMDDKKWAKKMFFFSLIALMIFSITISLNAWLP